MDPALPVMDTPIRVVTTRKNLQQRRLARTIPSRSPQGVVLYVVRDALAPTWSPETSSSRLVDYVRGDLGVLQRARSRLLASSRERISLCQSRALDTVDEAIAKVQDDRVSWGDGG